MPDNDHRAPIDEPPIEPLPDPDASPFETPTYEIVEKGIGGPWEKRSDDDA
jgi:hypothetical protein